MTAIASSQCSRAGTTAMRDGKLVGIGDAAAQAEQCFRNIEAALTRAGSSMTDVVRTRVYITRHGDWEAIGHAHGEAFGTIRPASTMVVVKGFLEPAWLVEMEFDAVLPASARVQEMERNPLQVGP